MGVEQREESAGECTELHAVGGGAQEQRLRTGRGMLQPVLGTVGARKRRRQLVAWNHVAGGQIAGGWR